MTSAVIQPSCSNIGQGIHDKYLFPGIYIQCWTHQILVQDRFEAVVEGWASLSLVGNMMARLRQWARQHAETPDGRNFLGQLLAGGSIAVSKKAFVQELLFVDPLNFKARYGPYYLLVKEQSRM